MNAIISLIVGKLMDWLLVRLGNWYDKLEKKIEEKKETSKAISDAEKQNDTSGIFKP